ncbi:Flp pilus assembly protein CpaB [Desulfonatronovibrio magnus]|uniref:Flp pilus assembly protein CpaB n=1 Tax=Desulfonatronovibrio magnus TaxID=698827 RepID=UPI0005EB9CC8|nr:Flp pilus assembly protein CpaB [Desulfonatronovibrio magnus]
MSNTKALLISLLVAVFAVIMLMNYISSRERAILELATPVQVVAALRDMPEGTRVEPGMIELVTVPQKYVQPGAFNDIQRVVNRSVNVPVLRGTQVLESMFFDVEIEGIAPKIPTGKRAFSIFVTDVTSVGQLIQPGDMVDIMVTVEIGSFQDGRAVSEEVITKTALENILVLAVDQTSSVRRTGTASGSSQQAPGSVFSAGNTAAGSRSTQIKTLSLSVSPREVQILNLSQEIGTLSASLRSSFDTGQVENLPPLSAQDFLGIDRPIIPRSSPAWVEIRGADFFSRF